MSHCLILRHDDTFAPGRVVPVFRDYGIPTRVRRADEGDLPDAIHDVRLLVVLGGRARLTQDRPEWADAEVAFLKQFVEADRPVLALGMGAVMLAEAAGAAVRPLATGEGDAAVPTPFHGWGTIRLPFPGGTDSLMFGLGDGAPMVFYQGDAYDLPRLPPPAGHDPSRPGPPPPSGNLLLASASHDKNAGFRFKHRLYGLNFHPELDRDMVDALLPRVADTDRHFARYERLGTRLLENLVQYFRSYDPPV